jgi:hypothetical protein
LRSGPRRSEITGNADVERIDGQRFAAFVSEEKDWHACAQGAGIANGAEGSGSIIGVRDDDQIRSGRNESLGRNLGHGINGIEVRRI